MSTETVKTKPIYSFWRSPRSFVVPLNPCQKLAEMLKIPQKSAKTLKSWSNSVPKNQINRVHLKKQSQFVIRRNEYTYLIWNELRQCTSGFESRKANPIQSQFRRIIAPASICPSAGRNRWLGSDSQRATRRIGVAKGPSPAGVV